MKAAAISQAKVSLGYAREAVDAMRACRSFDQLQRAWRDYLVAYYEIYEKLKAGSKGKNGRSRSWYHGVKRARQDDDLLNYLYQARNNETHGLEPSVRLDGPLLEKLADPNAKVSPDRIGKEIIIRIPTKSGKPSVLKMTMPTKVRLAPVTDDRFNKTFPAPTMHLGTKLKGMTIPDAAELALRYLESIIVEGEALQSEPLGQAQDPKA